MSEEIKTNVAPAAAAAARPERPARPFGKKRFESRRKVCKVCAEKIDNVDYKNFQFVKSFTNNYSFQTSTIHKHFILICISCPYTITSRSRTIRII